jgi:cell division protein FtsB
VPHNVKYQIFVSSTYQDLKSSRDSVIWTILKMYQIPIGMEMFNADDDEQWQTIKETIDQSDYYILILGHRYGSTTTEGISYTEKEFDYAVEIGVPILSFIRERDVSTTPNEREGDSKKTARLEKFIEKAKSSRMCDFWTTEEELASKVGLALHKIFLRKPRSGWIRSEEGMSVQVSEEMARLSKENRELKEELADFKDKLQSRSPNLQFDITFEDIELPFLKPLESFSSAEMPSKIDIVPPHLKEFITVEEIEEYNSNLPEQEAIDEFNKSLETYYRIKENSFKMIIEVGNIGNSPANDVVIDAIFPDSLLVMKEIDLEEIKKPISPIPANVLREAESKYQESLRPAIFSSISYPTVVTSNRNLIGSNIYSSLGALSNPPNRSWIEDNVITMRMEKILQTRAVIFSEIWLVPLSKGKHEIKVSSVCDEFPNEKVDQFIQVVN